MRSHPAGEREFLGANFLRQPWPCVLSDSGAKEVKANASASGRCPSSRRSAEVCLPFLLQRLRFKRAREVENQVIRVLETDAEAHKAIRNADRRALFGCLAAVRCEPRLAHQRIDPCSLSSGGDQVSTVDDERTIRKGVAPSLWCAS